MNPLKLGHVHLKVRNLDRSIDFYTRIFGLRVEERVTGYAFLTDGNVHHLVALKEMGPAALPASPTSMGLYHAAFEVGSEKEFEEAQARLTEQGVAWTSVDHTISWATYFSDPDGNGLEIYLDRRSVTGGRRTWQGVSHRLAENRVA